MATSNRDDALKAIETLINNSLGDLSFDTLSPESVAESIVNAGLEQYGMDPNSDEYKAAFELNYNYLIGQDAFQQTFNRFKMGMDYVSAAIKLMPALVSEIINYRISYTQTSGGEIPTETTANATVSTNPDIKQTLITLESLSDKIVDLISQSIEWGIDVDQMLINAPDQIQSWRSSLLAI